MAVKTVKGSIDAELEREYVDSVSNLSRHKENIRLWNHYRIRLGKVLKPAGGA